MDNKIKAYKLKNIKIYTYDGRTFDAECDRIFKEQPRSKIEDFILNDVKKIMKGDIPVRATFNMVEI